MDPDVVLTRVREAVVALRAAAEGDSNDAEIAAAHELADAVEGLDEWLSKGGFRPTPWRRTARVWSATSSPGGQSCTTLHYDEEEANMMRNALRTNICSVVVTEHVLAI